MAATLAVCRVVEGFGCRHPTIKWPNDVRVGGLKISGILIESAMDSREVAYAVVGIGVNVNLDPQMHEEIAATATSLLKETGKRQDRTRVLVTLLEHLDDLYARVKADESLTDEWASRLDTLGKTVQVRWGDTVIEGMAEGVDSVGNLVLKLPDGSAFTASAGEVTLQV
jgi:BirA family biotin operon repressor/biotin-[acetyl-CoA-carboxylase] ligase